MEVWSDRVSTCKFRNARSAFRNLHVDPLSLHTFMRNKQVEFNPYIYTLNTLSKLYRFGYEISVFNTKHPVIILRASLFVVTPSHVASTTTECQNFSYVYRSRKHWECKYNKMVSCNLFNQPSMSLLWAHITNLRNRNLTSSLQDRNVVPLRTQILPFVLCHFLRL